MLLSWLSDEKEYAGLLELPDRAAFSRKSDNSPPQKLQRHLDAAIGNAESKMLT